MASIIFSGKGMQASTPAYGEPKWAYTRNRPPGLFQMPHMWQPNLHMPSPYHSSHCDRAQLGWRKWGADYPDFYARRAEATHPDWYTRRVTTVRHGDTKERLWPWELTSRPTEKQTYGDHPREIPQPITRGFHAVPHEIEGQIRMSRWGLYHPDSLELPKYHQHRYDEPQRAEPLPPVHAFEKHL